MEDKTYETAYSAEAFGKILDNSMICTLKQPAAVLKSVYAAVNVDFAIRG